MKRRWIGLDISEHGLPEPAIVVLEPGDAHRLKLVRLSRFTPEGLAQHVAEHPRLSLRTLGQNEYVVGGYWRRRSDIGHIVEMTLGKYREPLLLHLVEVFRQRGAKLVVASCNQNALSSRTGRIFGQGEDAADAASCASMYARLGFVKLDEIIELERRGCAGIPEARAISARLASPGDLPAVLEIDAAAFPWLWHNSGEELAWYVRLDGVEVYVAEWGNKTIGYAGITVQGQIGHVDRLAIRPELQGQGLGKALMAFLFQRMRSLGVSWVGLSTQSDNDRAQKLYYQFGFQRTFRVQSVYGLWLREQAV